jgi:hypothetical protein
MLVGPQGYRFCGIKFPLFLYRRKVLLTKYICTHTDMHTCAHTGLLCVTAYACYYGFVSVSCTLHRKNI